MLVTTDFFDDLMIRHFRFDYETLQKRRDQALVSSAKQLINALESGSQLADALAYQLQDYVDRKREAFISEAFIETPKTEEKPKRKAKAKK